LIADIEDAMAIASTDEMPSFGRDLRARLIEQARAEMASGRMDSYGFEGLVATVLRSLGAQDVRIIGRSIDLGVDIVATFSVAETFPIQIGVQAKHFRPEPPVSASVVDQLATGMQAEAIRFGWIATSGSFSPEAISRKAEVEEELGLLIELVDGEQLAALVVEGGLRAVGLASEGIKEAAGGPAPP
jgi:restriction endonuclease Mrr